MIAEHVLTSYPQLMNAFFEQREGLSDRELVEVDFRSLQQEPIETLSTIYRQLSLPDFDAAVPHFEEYLESQRNYRKNSLPLRAGERKAVAERWRDMFERLGYPV
jgi:hypothetical protein